MESQTAERQLVSQQNKGNKVSSIEEDLQQKHNVLNSKREEIENMMTEIFNG